MRFGIIVLLILVLTACIGPEPRKPVKVKSASFYKESAERSRQLLEHEEELIQDIIAKDTIHSYKNSASGSWYYMISKNEADDYTAHPDDLVTMTYDILTLNNDTIYSMEEIGIMKYKVDKQELFSCLRSAVKLLKENESATFFFPSSIAHGYQGDNDRIGVKRSLEINFIHIKNRATAR